MEENWLRNDVGELVLSGTPFRIRYDASKDSPFVLIDNRGRETGYYTLGCAKFDAVWKANELLELGVI